MKAESLLIVALFGLFACVAWMAGADPLTVLTLGAAGLGMSILAKDDALIITRALPNGAATVSSTGFDLETSTRSEFIANCELLIEAPALVVGDLGNGDTMIYDLYHDTASDFSTETLLADNVITQTGAGGAGAAAASKRFRFPSDVKRYVRVKVTNSGAGDASDKTATLSLVF